MEIKDKIKSRRLELGLTLDEVAQKIGVAASTFQRYESGEIKNMRRDKVKKIADVLELSPSYLMGWSEQSDTTEFDSSQYDNIIPLKKDYLKKIPLVGDIACGEPILANEEYESLVVIDGSINADFCLRCTGDSMVNARILDGDIVFIHKQDAVENGEIAAVIIDNEATLKRVNYKPEKNMLILKAENPKYDDFVYIGEELETIKILGKAVAFQSNIK